MAGDPANIAGWAVGNTRDYDIFRLSCISPAFCVGGELQGRLQSSAQPGTAWAEVIGDHEDDQPIGSNASVQGVACPSSTLCVAVNEHGRIHTAAPLPAISAPASARVAAWRRGLKVSISGLRPRSGVALKAGLGGLTFGQASGVADASGRVEIKLRTSSSVVVLKNRGRFTLGARLTTLAGHTFTLYQRVAVTR
jgi:hypothetical protein